MNKLSEILAKKRERLAADQERLPLEPLKRNAEKIRAVAQKHSLKAALQREDAPNIIAEFKRRSPSKGVIREGARPSDIARQYESGGAAAISVLTEEDYFNGSLDDLRAVRRATDLPILRKDFIFDEYQVYESALGGADALLLIAAALADEQLIRLRTITEDELQMDALVEVHTEGEMQRAAATGATIIGVNNRDLTTFEVTLSTSFALARTAPAGAILVSESGIETAREVSQLRANGYHGFLIGETLMKSDDPTARLREFISAERLATSNSAPVQIKICGITNLADGLAAVDAGADMLGFNFYPKSPRYIHPATARTVVQALRVEIAAKHRAVRMIGVFVNEPLERITSLVDDVQLDGIQLHGDESFEFCSRLKSVAPQVYLIKAFATRPHLDIATIQSWPADALMFDASDDSLRGGTGRLADWNIAFRAGRHFPSIFLAGGLSAANVASAIAAVRPFAVDACTSLEAAPGRKDATRMHAFVRAVRNG